VSGALRMHVSAGILTDANGRVLIAERLGDSPFAGLWEFPGGKIHDDETPDAALRRELREELDIEVDECEHFMQLMHEYADRSVALEFFKVLSWQRQPRGCDGQALAWRKPLDIDVAELLPANAAVLRALQGESAPVTRHS
jgi:8-oxo-dGTP diphosphatase